MTDANECGKCVWTYDENDDVYILDEGQYNCQPGCFCPYPIHIPGEPPFVDLKVGCGSIGGPFPAEGLKTKDGTAVVFSQLGIKLGNRLIAFRATKRNETFYYFRESTRWKWEVLARYEQGRNHPLTISPTFPSTLQGAETAVFFPDGEVSPPFELSHLEGFVSLRKDDWWISIHASPKSS